MQLFLPDPGREAIKLINLHRQALRPDLTVAADETHVKCLFTPRLSGKVALQIKAQFRRKIVRLISD